MSESTVVAVCVASRRGGAKEAVQRARFVADFGIEGDAHAGPWHRQISLLAADQVDSMRSRGVQLAAGAFGENLVVEGARVDELGIGSVLRVGEAEIEITQVGKVCHDRCAIYQAVGDCIMPSSGLFARVVSGGEVRPGMAVQVVRSVSRSRIQAGVVTVSDSAAAGTAADTSGPAVAELLRDGLQARIAMQQVVGDEESEISQVLITMADRGLDLVVTTGGTGCAARDVTPEATRAVTHREVPGLAEAMRAASAEITPNAWLQRGVAGIRASTLILNLPGSRKAAVENLEAVAGVLGHAVALLRGDTAHPQADR